MIEIETFRLAEAVDENAFLEADAAYQVEIFNVATGAMRRTTARGDDGEWVVVCLWDSAADADAARERGRGHALEAHIEQASRRIERYTPLER